LISGSGPTGAGRISGLRHEVVINAVEGDSIIESFLRQVHKGVYCQRGFFRIELEGHLAIFGLNGGSIGLFHVDHPFRALFHQAVFDLDHFHDGFDSRGIPVVDRASVHEDGRGGAQADAVGVVNAILDFLLEFFTDRILRELFHVQLECLCFGGEPTQEFFRRQFAPVCLLCEED